MWCWVVSLSASLAFAEPPPTPVLRDGELDAATAAGVPNTVVTGAEAMGLSPSFVVEVRTGLELLYQRQYDATLAYFSGVEQRWSGVVIDDVAEVLVWQARMLENFDYRFEKEYEAASSRARKGLEAAQRVPGNDAWERLMLTGVSGIEAIHAARRGRYLAALTLAFEAIDHVERTREAAPDFVDLQLADGLYNYWRTVLTNQSSLLPSFGDHRKKGIAQMEAVQEAGLFLGPPATLSLSYTWFEEQDNEKLMEACARNHNAYPDNIISETMYGIALLKLKKYGEAIEAFEHIRTVDPSNRRSLYWSGRAHQKDRQYDEALAIYTTYLVEAVEPYHSSWTHYRIGQIHEVQKAYDTSERHYRTAIKIDGHKDSKVALERVRKKRRLAE
ncbi:MAG: tetratricopeptide repeat protein [Myxococcota bacterium]